MDNVYDAIAAGTELSSIAEAVMIDRRAAYDGQVLATGPAGSLIVFNGATWHGRSAHTSDGRRRALQGAFIP